MATILKTLLDEAHAAADEQVLAEQLGDSLTETLVKHDSARNQ
jgi:hypothetical protein